MKSIVELILFSKSNMFFLGLLFLLLLTFDTNTSAIPYRLRSFGYHQSHVTIFDSQANLNRAKGIVPWSECITRFPGLLENEIYVPLPYGLADENAYIPKQADIPVYVIVYNNPTFVKNMVEQIDCYGSHALLLDSGSTYQPMLDYLKNIENGPPSRSGIRHKVIYLQHNAGPYGAFAADLFADMPPFVAITDPDIYFNPHLPPNFLVTFANLTKLYPGRKIGFALSLDNSSKFWPFVIDTTKRSIVTWESQFWVHPINMSTLNSYSVTNEGTIPFFFQAYDAAIDTTFAVYDVVQTRSNCKFNRCHFFKGMRVAGPFTAEHKPWYINFTASWNKSEISAAYGDGSKGATISTALQAFGWV